MTPEQIAEIRARVDAATPGPWVVDKPTLKLATQVNGGIVYLVRNTKNEQFYTMDDFIFISHAREDIPTLLAERDRLTAALDEREDAIRHITRQAQTAEAERDAQAAILSESDNACNIAYIVAYRAGYETGYKTGYEKGKLLSAEVNADAIKKLVDEREQLKAENESLKARFCEGLCGDLQSECDRTLAERDRFEKDYDNQRKLAEKLLAERDRLVVKCKDLDEALVTQCKYSEELLSDCKRLATERHHYKAHAEALERALRFTNSDPDTVCYACIHELRTACPNYCIDGDRWKFDEARFLEPSETISPSSGTNQE